MRATRKMCAAIAAALLASLVLATVAPASAEPRSPSRVAQATEPAEQEPFLCTTGSAGLGQPIVDNDERRGTPVYPTNDAGEPDRAQDPIGWSARCQAEPVVEYRYRSTEGSVVTLDPNATELPDDIEQLPVEGLIDADRMGVADEAEIPFLFRYERGTLPENRFVYSIATLASPEQALGEDPDAAPRWNGRLLFSFGGGVGVGHSQGQISSGDSQHREALMLGHGVVYSGGTRTSTHYNLLLGGRTAVELKDLFRTRIGEPVYTVGIGGSGGGIQQYVYEQNHPELLDALIPQYSYPDMSTQTIHIGDCELLAHYMDELDADNPRWQDWDNRKLVQGLNSIQGFSSSWQERTDAPGSTECIEGWRGATPLAMNPTFGFTEGMDDAALNYVGELLGLVGAGEPASPADFPDLGRLLRASGDPELDVEWSHWKDVVEVYGRDPNTGFARVPWDNVGVQYGLQAVANGSLPPEEFLDLNARVGTWKEPEDNTPESCGVIAAMLGDELAGFAAMVGICEGDHLDEHSAAQMIFSEDADQPAPRRSGDVEAITAAYEGGLVFLGELEHEVPILDVRHYLEHVLDMHNSQQSFGVRARLERGGYDLANHLIWFLDARPERDDEATHRLLLDAFTLVEDWMEGILDGQSVSEARPTAAVDKCWSADGTLIAEGSDVWSGAPELITTGGGAWAGEAPEEVGGVPVGDCTAAFPLFSTSRIVAGGPITGDVYKCQLQPVATAIEAGLYGTWEPSSEEQTRLEAIFPDGVCDYDAVPVGAPFSSVVSGRPTGEVAAPGDTGGNSDDSGSSAGPVVAVVVGLVLAAAAVGAWLLTRRRGTTA